MPFRLLIAPVAALMLATLIGVSAEAGDYTDSAGRRVTLPDHVSRVLTAGPSADALVAVLAPNELMGWSRPPQPPYLPKGIARLPVTGLMLGPKAPDAAGTVARLHPDLVIAAGVVTPERAALADQLQQETGVPVILVDDSMTRIAGVLRSVGAVLGVKDHAEDLAVYAEHAVDALRGRLLIQPASPRPRVYYARGADGLETALPGSPAGEFLDEAGAINVAGVLGRGERVRVSVDQVQGWGPDIIIAEQRSFYNTVRRAPGWSHLSAVSGGKVYLAPASPFGWVDDPPGVNRLIGLYWMSDLLYRDATQEDLRDTVSEFYDTFYKVKLTDKDLDALVKPAEPPRSKDPMEALLGIDAPSTAIPPLTLPGEPGRRGGNLPSTQGIVPPGMPMSPSPLAPPKY
ncbi:MAG TPA: ABC transporter substrate-binding protein [Stellaceae bacterium]|jgi:iron complex transport system substrate-binding protein